MSMGMSQNHCTNRSTNLPILEVCTLWNHPFCVLVVPEKMQRSVNSPRKSSDSNTTSFLQGSYTVVSYNGIPQHGWFIMGNHGKSIHKWMIWGNPPQAPVFQHLAAKTSHARLTPWGGREQRQADQPLVFQVVLEPLRLLTWKKT